jgi:hypothetical protein
MDSDDSQRRLNLKKSQLHPSLIEQPLISKKKELKKEKRDKEQRKIVTELTETEENISNKLKDRYIKLIEENEKCNIKEELNN